MNNFLNIKLILIKQSKKAFYFEKKNKMDFDNRLVVGQVCAALFNGDWYRARVLEIGESRVRVQYIDW